MKFKEHEAAVIELFLRQNPFFDFSTLARIAILEFIKDPRLPISAIDARALEAENKKVN